MEHCYHEQDWGRVLTRLEELYKDFYGNGQPGALASLLELKVSVKELTEQSQANATSLSVIAKFVTESEAVGKYKEQDKLSSKQRTAIIITSIIGIAGVAATLLSEIIAR